MKRVSALCAILLLIFLTGCGEKKDIRIAAARDNAGKATAPPATNDAVILPQATKEAADFYDVDLTQMSGTMVYSYVFSVMSDPEQYIGKRFRIVGSYEMSNWSATGLDYHFVVIADATACCAQGIEFVLPDGLEYPAEGDHIEITGTFGSYQELGDLYYYIQADSIRSYE